MFLNITSHEGAARTLISHAVMTNCYLNLWVIFRAKVILTMRGVDVSNHSELHMSLYLGVNIGYNNQHTTRSVRNKQLSKVIN